ncbi:DUF4083 domain-containing protein [Bacillus infantis]|uniref:DUF4083 domain-containing protein n=2 Tax=Bacillaceae TaxID=186817 RepID=A0A5D4SRX6_9BACI|nr:DUF4083 domain-containing protein [Bacillus infantis]OXT18250.1 hypothetical protein B9K06_07020 [Bacillus sp. OG2]RYI29472.1 DUF4083 domain-containing protein [Bacillus infantis]TYS64902.1 DUF4083 domain-containing protein [Bacillus infantis]
MLYWKKRKVVERMFNSGDLIFQILMLAVMAGMVFAVYFLVRWMVIGKPESKMEQKLDRIIELLEEDKKS